MATMWRRGAWTRRRIALVVVAVVLVLLVAGQFVLPAIATDVVRSKVGDPSAKVTVKAYPAWKLAFGHVDRLRVSSPTFVDADRSLTDVLRRARKVDRLDARIGAMTFQRLPLRNVHASIHDRRVTATAEVAVADLATMVPGGGTLTALPDQGDGRPRFDATVSVLGVRSQVRVVVTASDGAIEVSPDGGIGSLLRFTVFENPALRIDDVRGRVTGDQVALTVTGQLQ